MSNMHPGTIGVIVVVSICFIGIVIVCVLYCAKKYKLKQSGRDRLPSPIVVDHEDLPTGCCGTGFFCIGRPRETGNAWTAKSQKTLEDSKNKLPPPEIDLDFLPFTKNKSGLSPEPDVRNRAPPGTVFLLNPQVPLSAKSTRVHQLPPIVAKHSWK